MGYANRHIETREIASIKDVAGSTVIWQETVPSGGFERNFLGAQLINGITPATTTAGVVTITHTPSGGAAETLGTITWSSTQAAWTGVAMAELAGSRRLGVGDKLSAVLTTAPGAATTAILKLWFE